MRDRIIQDIQDSIRVKEDLIKTLVPQIERASQMLCDSLRKGGKVLFFGNGGSAADSQHMAAEFVGRYEKERRGLPSIALTTDTSILTAVANDYGYDRVFERQIEALGRPGDVAVGISTSGNSPSVTAALRRAKEMGLATIAFSGRDGGKMRGLADVDLIVPAQRTSRIQESHILIGHILCARVDEALAGA